MFTLTRWQLATAGGLTALVVLASIGTAMTFTPTTAPSNVPASGGTALVAGAATAHADSDATKKPRPTRVRGRR
jgi:hypothetical protein